MRLFDEIGFDVLIHRGQGARVGRRHERHDRPSAAVIQPLKDNLSRLGSRKIGSVQPKMPVVVEEPVGRRLDYHQSGRS
jgi:hypothetical protein